MMMQRNRSNYKISEATTGGFCKKAVIKNFFTCLFACN